MILVSGATGFVGKALILNLQSQERPVKALVRVKVAGLPSALEQVLDIDFSSFFSDITIHKLTKALDQVDVVIHTAARVHVMQDDVSDPLLEFRKVNRDGTLALAKMAAKSGVKRFIFISSIKVNGESTGLSTSFTEKDDFIPTDPYGLSKYEAEQGLLALAKETGMEVVIIRPPLVYGPGVKANFASMINWMKKGIPLPFGAIHNKRSLVALDNLVDFIVLCADREKSPKAANQVFLISDGEDVSTTQLLHKVAKALGKKAWLIPVPVSWMSFCARLIGKKDVANRLFGSLLVDSSKARNLLGWKPVITMDEQLKKAVGCDVKLKDK